MSIIANKDLSDLVYTADNIPKLNYLEVYENLMKASTGDNSVFVKTNEILKEYVNDDNLTPQERANIIAKTLENLVANLSTQAMTIALEVAKEERYGKYAIEKLKRETLSIREQTNKIVADNYATNVQYKYYVNKVDEENAYVELKTREVVSSEKQTTLNTWKTQAELKQVYGVNTLPSSYNVSVMSDASFDKDGLIYNQSLNQKITSYAIGSKAYRDAGQLQFTIDSTGSMTTFSDLSGEYVPLMESQKQATERQAQAYDDNMVQHAVNSSSSMIGMLLSTDNGGALTDDDVNRWRTGIDYLESNILK